MSDFNTEYWQNVIINTYKDHQAGTPFTEEQKQAIERAVLELRQAGVRTVPLPDGREVDVFGQFGVEGGTGDELYFEDEYSDLPQQGFNVQRYNLNPQDSVYQDLGAEQLGWEDDDLTSVPQQQFTPQQFNPDLSQSIFEDKPEEFREFDEYSTIPQEQFSVPELSQDGQNVFEDSIQREAFDADEVNRLLNRELETSPTYYQDRLDEFDLGSSIDQFRPEGGSEVIGQDRFDSLMDANRGRTGYVPRNVSQYELLQDEDPFSFDVDADAYIQGLEEQEALDKLMELDLGSALDQFTAVGQVQGGGSPLTQDFQELQEGTPIGSVWDVEQDPRQSDARIAFDPNEQDSISSDQIDITPGLQEGQIEGEGEDTPEFDTTVEENPDWLNQIDIQITPEEEYKELLIEPAQDRVQEAVNPPYFPTEDTLTSREFDNPQGMALLYGAARSPGALVDWVVNADGDNLWDPLSYTPIPTINKGWRWILEQAGLKTADSDLAGSIDRSFDNYLEEQFPDKNMALRGQNARREHPYYMLGGEIASPIPYGGVLGAAETISHLRNPSRVAKSIADLTDNPPVKTKLGEEYNFDTQEILSDFDYPDTIDITNRSGDDIEEFLNPEGGLLSALGEQSLKPLERRLDEWNYSFQDWKLPETDYSTFNPKTDFRDADTDLFDSFRWGKDDPLDNTDPIRDVSKDEFSLEPEGAEQLNIFNFDNTEPLSPGIQDGMDLWDNADYLDDLSEEERMRLFDTAAGMIDDFKAKGFNPADVEARQRRALSEAQRAKQRSELAANRAALDEAQNKFYNDSFGFNTDIFKDQATDFTNRFDSVNSSINNIQSAQGALNNIVDFLDGRKQVQLLGNQYDEALENIKYAQSYINAIFHPNNKVFGISFDELSSDRVFSGSDSFVKTAKEFIRTAIDELNKVHKPFDADSSKDFGSLLNDTKDNLVSELEDIEKSLSGSYFNKGNYRTLKSDEGLGDNVLYGPKPGEGDLPFGFENRRHLRGAKITPMHDELWNRYDELGDDYLDNISDDYLNEIIQDGEPFHLKNGLLELYYRTGDESILPLLDWDQTNKLDTPKLNRTSKKSIGEQFWNELDSVPFDDNIINWQPHWGKDPDRLNFVGNEGVMQGMLDDSIDSDTRKWLYDNLPDKEYDLHNNKTIPLDVLKGRYGESYMDHLSDYQLMRVLDESSPSRRAHIVSAYKELSSRLPLHERAALEEKINKQRGNLLSNMQKRDKSLAKFDYNKFMRNPKPVMEFGKDDKISIHTVLEHPEIANISFEEAKNIYTAMRRYYAKRGINRTSNSIRSLKLAFVESYGEDAIDFLESISVDPGEALFTIK